MKSIVINPNIAVLIKTNGDIVEVKPENGTDFNLKELQEYVGGYIEIVRPLRNIPFKNMMLIVNEEGKLNELEYNAVASYIYGYSTDCIVGNALLVPNRYIK